MGVKDYSLNADDNTQINGINIAEGCPPSGINNAIRQLMADVKADSDDQNNTASTPATSTSLGPVIPQTGDEDGLELEKDGKLRVRKATATQRGSVLASVTAMANTVPQAGADGRLDPSWVYAGLPLGHIFAWPFPTAPDGCIILNGSNYSRTLYADFFAYIKSKGWTKTETEWQSIAQANNGYCPWYSEGDGSTNFRTPKFAPYQKIALVSGDAGTYTAEGLPNITGTVGPIDGHTTGAFRLDGITLPYGGTQTVSRNASTFNASRSSPIYGNSAHVTPESNDWIVCAVAFGTATNVGSVDIANVMSAVGQVQANPNLQGTAHIVKIWKSADGTSWYRKWSDGFIEQGGFIVAGASKTVSFFINFTDNLPHVNLGLVTNRSVSSYDSELYPTALTRTSFTVSNLTQHNTATCAGAYWYACGY